MGYLGSSSVPIRLSSVDETETAELHTCPRELGEADDCEGLVDTSFANTSLPGSATVELEVPIRTRAGGLLAGEVAERRRGRSFDSEGFLDVVFGNSEKDGEAGGFEQLMLRRGTR